MRFFRFAGLAAWLCAGLLMVSSGAEQPMKKVGVFDRNAIVYAYYHSPAWKNLVSRKQSELEAARLAEDDQSTQRAQDWLNKSQDMVKNQFSDANAPIPNILAALKPAFEEMKKTDGLADVVQSDKAEREVVQVDLTERLLDWLKIDKKTRDTIHQLHK
jgi:hypothetical protein